MEAKRLSGYLDTNLIIGLVEEDLGAELPALRELLRRRKAGEITLCTSHVASEELARGSQQASGRNEDIYLLLDDVPVVDEQFRAPGVLGTVAFGGGYLGGGGGPIVQDAALAQLLKILPGEDDARHVFQAAKNGVDYFVTCDVRTLLKHAAAVQSAVGIAVRLPSQVVAELEAVDLGT
jgi:predicted nucleic acid-binding protein